MKMDDVGSSRPPVHALYCRPVINRKSRGRERETVCERNKNQKRNDNSCKWEKTNEGEIAARLRGGGEAVVILSLTSAWSLLHYFLRPLMAASKYYQGYQVFTKTLKLSVV
jgi:hypothetical protein